MKKNCSFSRDSEREIERENTPGVIISENDVDDNSDDDWIGEGVDSFDLSDFGGVDEEDDCGNDWVGRRREEVHRTMASLYFLLSVHLFAFYSGFTSLFSAFTSLYLCPQFFCTVSVHSSEIAVFTLHNAQCTMYTLFHGISHSLPFCTLYLSQPLYLSTPVPHIYLSLLLCRPFCNTIVHSSAALHCCALHWDYRVFTNVAQCLPLHASTQMHCSTVQYSAVIRVDMSKVEEASPISSLPPHCPFAHLQPYSHHQKKYICHILRNTFGIF